MCRYIILIIILCQAVLSHAQVDRKSDSMPRHCLLPDTKITMKDDSMKDISEIKEGDIVLSFNAETREYEEAEVVKVHSIMHNRYSRITIKSGAFIEVTSDLPFASPTGWASMNPEMANGCERYKDEKIDQLDEATTLLYYDITTTGEADVKSIDGVIEIIDTYSLELNNNGAYIANSFIVGQE